MSGPDQTPNTDPIDPDLPLPDLPRPGTQDEQLAAQDGTAVSPSQVSLLRMFGWRPGDPLPDLDGLGDPLDEAGDDAGLPAAVSDRGQSLGGAEAASHGNLLLAAEPEPVVPINWNTLDAERAEQEWGQLDAFVYWLRDDFGLTPQELPPMWHRHPELVWELSALRTSWLAGHAEDAHPGSPLMWLRDLSDSRRRLRDWVQRCGTTLTEDRPSRLTTWPGEQAASSPVPITVTDRAADFAVFVADDIARRRRIEADAQAEMEQARAEQASRLRRSWGLPAADADRPAPHTAASDLTDQEDQS